MYTLVMRAWAREWVVVVSKWVVGGGLGGSVRAGYIFIYIIVHVCLT